MRIVRLALVLAIVPGSLPAQAGNQRQGPGQRCEIQSASTSTRGTTLRDEGRTFMGGGVFFECRGGTTIRSDSLAHFEAAGMIEFFGNVHYADTVKTLSAEYIRYIGRISQVIAQDSVVLSDIATGSEIRAPYLEYFQATETRPEALVRIPSGRPRAILISRPGDAPPQDDLTSASPNSSTRQTAAGRAAPDRRDPDTTGAETPDPPDSSVSRVADVEPPDSTFIDADAMDFYGERLAVARGNVVVLRRDMQAFGREAHYDQRADSMLITGESRVVTDDYKLNGDTIAALLTPERDLRQVNAWRETRLESEDLEAEAPGLRILFEDGEVHRMIALGEQTGSRGAEPVEIEEGARPEDTARSRETAKSADTTQPGKSAQSADTTRPGKIAQSADTTQTGKSAQAADTTQSGEAEPPEQTVGRMAAGEQPLVPAQLAHAPLPNPPRPAERPHTGVQARVTSKDVRMVGDSIDALAPDQQIERVIAVGTAFGERLTADTTVLRPAIAENDWMRGDTIIAMFAEAPDSAASDSAVATVTAAADTLGATGADSVGAERVLESLTAVGISTDAQSLYAVASEEDPAAPPALSYLVAQHIHVRLRDGAVFDVNAVGRDGQPVHGLYLEPADSTPADTVARTERDP